MTPTESVLLATVLGLIVVVFLIAVYFDLRKQERDRPKENWRGPFPVRYFKHLAGKLLDGLPGIS
ncbi:MAG: hypothetical protein C0524_08720 [Rhodobacter sp.]|nr:hypothetical protein [Rhodobacter sp.]